MSGPRRIVNSLAADGPAASSDLAVRLGMLRKTVTAYTRQLHDAGHIHIVGWQTPQRPIYAAGSGVDAVRPAPLTIAQKNRRYYRNVKADPVRRLDKLMRGRAHKARARSPPAPQSWLSSVLPQ